MDVKLVVKKSFSVIGKEGQGLAAESGLWLPPLWQAANENFNEINGLAKLDENGQLVGIWGAMSDVNHKFERWSESGKYLAGCEVVDEAIAPNGWTKWIVPSYQYALVKCTQDTYGEVFNYILQEYLPQNDFQVVGAVHEYYAPNGVQGDLYLYFPIHKLAEDN